ncbi:MAG: glycosyltransferase [Ignavibacteriota bacterium]
MKIVIVSPAYPLRGGIANFTAQLYQELSKSNDVLIFTFKRQYPKIFFPGKTQLEIGENTDKIPTEVEIDSINPISWKKTAEKIIETNPELVIFKYWLPFFAPCYSSIAKRIKKKSNAKLLAVCHNINPHEKRFGDKYLSKMFLSKMEYFILLSKEVENDLLKFISRPKLKVLSHPVYSRFGKSVDKQSAKEHLKLPDNNYILFFGFIRDYKGLDILFKALALLKDKNIKLIVAGEFYSDKERYFKMIDELNIKQNVFMFNDFIPTDEVKYYFSAADAVILPYKDATQSGIVQIAVNFQKPVIATYAGGLSEVIENEKMGYIVQKENPEQLANAICKFYNGNREKEFSQNISTLTEKYSWKRFVDGIFELIKA